MKITTAIISIMMVMLSLPSLHSQEPVRPAFLKEGDKIAIISPASMPDKLFVDGGAEILRQWGLIPVYGPMYARKTAPLPAPSHSAATTCNGH